MINTNPLKIPVIKEKDLKPLPGMKSLYFEAETGNLVAMNASGTKQIIAFNQFVITFSFTTSFDISKIESESTIRLKLTGKDSFQPGQNVLIQNSQLGVNDGYYTIKAIEEVPSLELGDTLTADIKDLLITFDQERLQTTQTNGELLIAKPTEVFHNLNSDQVLLQPQTFTHDSVSIKPEISFIDQNRIMIDPLIPIPGEYEVRVVARVSGNSLGKLL